MAVSVPTARHFEEPFPPCLWFPTMSTPHLQNNTPTNTAPIFYIIDGDMVQSQLLADILERKFQADCFCRQRISLSDIIALKPARLTVCLFDWEESEDTAEMEKRLDLGGAPCPPYVLPVLCNVNPTADIEKLANAKTLRGVFYAGESFSSFIDGLEAVLKGEVRLKRHTLGGSGERPAKPPVLSRSPLTSREIELIRQVASGASNRKIADQLGISPHTVKTHLYNIFKKVGVPNRLQATLWAIANLRR